jgi:hypothetical protein
MSDFVCCMCYKRQPPAAQATGPVGTGAFVTISQSFIVAQPYKIAGRLSTILQHGQLGNL